MKSGLPTLPILMQQCGVKMAFFADLLRRPTNHRFSLIRKCNVNRGQDNPQDSWLRS